MSQLKLKFKRKLLHIISNPSEVSTELITKIITECFFVTKKSYNILFVDH